MSESELLSQITVDLAVLTGNISTEDLLEDYPDLERARFTIVLAIGL